MNPTKDSEDLWCNPPENDSVQGHPIEDIIYILVAIMEQARDAYLEHCTNPKIKPKLKLLFNSSTTKLVELVRKDKDITYTNIMDDINLVKIILKWLYRAMDQNKKCLAPILRPYLNVIFATSHAISWHLDTIKRAIKSDELEALGVFASLINSGEISPAHGLVDAVNKNWIWAREMLKIIENGNLRLVFARDRGKVARHVLSLPLCKNNLKKDIDEKKVSTFTGGNYFNTLLNRAPKTETGRPQHCTLKITSPMTLVLHDVHRRGTHRCCGDVFESLISMHKANVVQELTHLLPQEERAEILEAIQKLSNERNRRLSGKKWASTLPPQLPKSSRPKYTFGEAAQKYTPKEESAGIRLKKNDVCLDEGGGTNNLNEIIKKLNKSDSLLGSCRAARIREDNSIVHFQENFRVKALNIRPKLVIRK